MTHVSDIQKYFWGIWDRFPDANVLPVGVRDSKEHRSGLDIEPWHSYAHLEWTHDFRALTWQLPLPSNVSVLSKLSVV